MEYFLLEFRETCEYFKKDTRRKKLIFINNWIKELQDKVTFLTDQFQNREYRDAFGTYGLYLGLKYRRIELHRFETELQYLLDNKQVLANM